MRLENETCRQSRLAVSELKKGQEGFLSVSLGRRIPRPPALVYTATPD